jgi:hypothetical protein
VNRAVPDPGFAGDDGSADPALAEALAAYAAGRAGEAAVLGALVKARLLVAVVALLAGEAEVGADGLRREKETDMALVTLTGRDGRHALPAFTSLDALTRWNGQARPVPVAAQRVCVAAYGENAELVVLDPAGPVTYLLEGPALRAVADGRVPLPPLRDPDVATAARNAVAHEPTLAAAYLLPARACDCMLGLVLARDVPERVGADVAQRVARRLGDDPILRDRLDRGMQLAVLPAGTAPSGGVVLLARAG